MITFSTLKESLYDWLDALTLGRSIIWLDQNAPRPSKPYIGLRLSPFVSIGQDYFTPPRDSDENILIQGNREFTLEIQHYGIDALQTLETINFSLQKFSVRESLSSGGIVFVDRLQINDISILLNAQYEERAAMDLLFRVMNSDTEELGIIEKAKIEMTYKDYDSSTMKTGLIEVNI